MERLHVYFFAVIIISADALQQADLDYIAANLDVKLSVFDNTKYDGTKHRLSLTLTNTGSKTIRPDNWSIYFYSFFMIEPDHLPSPEGYILTNYKVKLNHVKGSLFSMTPTADFPDITPNGFHYIEFFGQWWAVARSDIPPNWYITGPDLKPVNIKSTATGEKFVTRFSTVSQWKRYRVDQFNPFTPQDRYKRQKVRNFNTHTKKVIPTPKHVEVLSQQSLDLSKMMAVCTPVVSGSCALLRESSTIRKVSISGEVWNPSDEQSAKDPDTDSRSSRLISAYLADDSYRAGKERKEIVRKVSIEEKVLKYSDKDPDKTWT
ncbi:uncharacterized protein LOC134243275 [Saccostrea cucullata]|uniref:uncharacterized protein LOC134243275 n=1 Tax=Saccostrea cuccullata TaxID=36930 RepID=UPI002ED0A02B